MATVQQCCGRCGRPQWKPSDGEAETPSCPPPRPAVIALAPFLLPVRRAQLALRTARSGRQYDCIPGTAASGGAFAYKSRVSFAPSCSVLLSRSRLFQYLRRPSRATSRAAITPSCANGSSPSRLWRRLPGQCWKLPFCWTECSSSSSERSDWSCDSCHCSTRSSRRATSASWPSASRRAVDPRFDRRCVRHAPQWRVEDTQGRASTAA